MKKSVLLTLALILIAASPAAAAVNEYYTYGGFSPVTIAFSNIAAIFADPSYKGGIATFALFGLFFGCAGGMLKMATGQGGPLGWLLPFCLGAMIYFSMFIPTMSMSVYDPVYNQNKVIPGIPVGVVYVAGVVNHIERFVVDSYDSNATLAPASACGQLTPMQYAEFGGAVGMRLMQNSTTQYVQDAGASQTLIKYMDDCVTFEINRPGSTLSLNRLMTPGCGKSSLDVMGDAANPANFTTSYIASTAGTAESCSVVYAELTGFYGNPLNMGQPVANACGGTGFTDTARCQQILADMISGSSGESIDAAKFISNNTVTNITNQALLTGGGSSTTQYLTQMNQAQTGASSGFMAGIMNPYMIDAYVSYSFMLMPILAMFLVTPLWKNAFGLIISLVVWTTLIRCLDVITFHSWVTQYQMAAKVALDSAGMGIDAAMRLPMLSNQYLGTFASMRNSVFLLATAVSSVLFKFGDSAMARLADKANADHDGVKGAISDRGVAAKMAMDNSTGAARSSMMMAAAAGPHGWDNMGRGNAANEFGSAASGAGKLAASGGNVSTMMTGESTNSQRNFEQTTARSGKLSSEQARGEGTNQAAAEGAVLERMGNDGKTAKWSAGLATDQNLGQAKGFQAAHEEAKAGGYKGDIQQFQSDMSKVSTEKGFTDSQGWKDFVKDKFGGNEQAAMQSATNVAAFQLAKHSGEVGQVMEGSGKTATGAGGAVGKVTGNSELMSMASDSVRRGIAEDSADKSIKNDPRLYTQGHYTEEGKGKLAEMAAGHQKERAEAVSRSKEGALPKNERAQLQNLDKAQGKAHQAEQQNLLKDKAYSSDGKTLNEAGQTKMAAFDAKQQEERSNLQSKLLDGHMSKADQGKMKEFEGKQAADRQTEQQKLLGDKAYSSDGKTLNEAGQKKMAEMDGKQKEEQVGHKAQLQTGHMSAKSKADFQKLDSKQAGERRALESSLKNDPVAFQKGQLTEAGYAAQMGNIAGANQQKFTSGDKAYGKVEESKTVDRNGATVMSQEKGSVSKKEQTQALATEMRANGFKHAAKEIDKMAKEGKGFDFQMSRDKDGHITGFTATGGATATLNDKATEDRGRLEQYTNKKVNDTRDANSSGSATIDGNQVRHDNSNVTTDGKSHKTDNSTVLTDGKSHKTDNSTVLTDGKSHKTDNATVVTDGNSHKTDNAKVVTDGSSHKTDNARVVTDGSSHKTDNATVVTDGNSHKTDNLTSVQAGSKDDLYVDSSTITAGTKVDGALNSAVGELGAKVGLDRKSVEMGVGTVQNLVSDVLPAAQALSATRATHNAAKTSAAKNGTTPPGFPGVKAKVQDLAGRIERKLDPVKGRDEGGREVTRSGKVLNPQSAAPKAPQKPFESPALKGDGGKLSGGSLDGMSTGPKRTPDGYGSLSKPASPASSAPAAPRPQQQANAGGHGGARLDGLTNPAPSVANNGGYGTFKSTAAPAAPRQGGGAVKAPSKFAPKSSGARPGGSGSKATAGPGSSGAVKVKPAKNM